MQEKKSRKLLILVSKFVQVSDFMRRKTQSDVTCIKIISRPKKGKSENNAINNVNNVQMQKIMILTQFCDIMMSVDLSTFTILQKISLPNVKYASDICLSQSRKLGSFFR